jgi:hypothetical protein
MAAALTLASPAPRGDELSDMCERRSLCAATTKKRLRVRLVGTHQVVLIRWRAWCGANIGSASSPIDKFKLICDFSKRPIQSSKSICFRSLTRVPCTQVFCVHVNHQPVRPRAGRHLAVLSFAPPPAPRIPAVNERPSLIISCKNSKNSEGPFERTGEEICVHPVARKRVPALQAPGHHSGYPLSAGITVRWMGAKR